MANISAVSAASSPSYTPASASAGGDTIVAGSAQETILRVINGSGASVTVTVAAVNPCNQGVLHNQVLTCPANQTTDAVLDRIHCQTSSGNYGVTYSASASVTVAAINS